MWRESSLQMNRLAAANGILYFHFLQPTPHFPGSKPMGEIERRAAVREGGPEARAIGQAYPMMRDASLDLREAGDLIGFSYYSAQGVLPDLSMVPYPRDARTGPLGYAPWPEGLGLTIRRLADAQLHRFKQDPANKGKTCQVGLWHYSRHPNFFFEWLIWVSYALYAMGSPSGAWGWLSPALMLYFVTKVTGIPATEAQALRSRGDEYRKYQQTTSAFFPWPPKKQH